MKKRRRIPWDEHRREYVTAPSLSLRALAKKHELDWRTVQKRSKAERWAEQRERFREKMTFALYENVIDRARTSAQASWAEALQDVRIVRHLAAKKLQDEMTAGDELRPEEERVILTKTTGNGSRVRKETRNRRVRPDPRLVAEFLRHESELLRLLADVANPAPGGRRIVIE